MAFTALIDANVLYSAPVRDLLIELAAAKLYCARWSPDIHLEWMKIAQEKYPNVPAKKWVGLAKLMDAHAEDCLVVGYEPLIDVVTLPDSDDRHVLAAAIKGRADVIVTFNVKDFPSDALEVYDLEAQHPDVFLRHLIDLYPGPVVAAVRRIRARLKNPPYLVDEYLGTLERQGLVSTVSELQAFRDVL